MNARNRERVARNFVERFGRDRLAKLLQMLGEGASGPAIAAEFDVSRERVRQWKNAFGTVMTLYQVFPEVQRIADGA